MKQLQDKGILLGIKVDKGVQPLFGTDGETTVQVRAHHNQVVSAPLWDTSTA